MASGHHAPAIALAFDRLHRGGIDQLGAGGHRLLGDELIEP